MKGQTILETPCSQSTQNPGPGVQPPGGLPRYHMLKQHSSSSSRLLAANVNESSAGVCILNSPIQNVLGEIVVAICLLCLSHTPSPATNKHKEVSKQDSELKNLCVLNHAHSLLPATPLSSPAAGRATSHSPEQQIQHMPRRQLQPFARG